MQTQFNELTDAQWAIIAPFFPTSRKRKYDLRIIFNAILWLNRVGGQWRNLDSKYPYWQIVYYYFRIWTKLGLLDTINAELVKLERLRQEKSTEPTANTIDSQSVKIAPFIPEDKGIDGGKKINGRKRHIITDTLGLIIAVIVTAANRHDGVTACTFFGRVKNRLKNTKCIFADHTYQGQFQKLMDENDIKLEIAAKPESAKGFIPVKKRWVVERSFGWMNFFRRLAKDYERKVQNSESMIYLAQIQIILNRLQPRPN
jgi:putative transposase